MKKVGQHSNGSADPYPHTEDPRIRTTTVGSFPYPAWLAAMPTEQSLMDNSVNAVKGLIADLEKMGLL